MSCARGCCASPAEHYRSVRFQSAPTAVTLTERRWDRDMDAYARLRKNGLQPKCIDGSGDLETRAETTFEIESGRLIQNRTERNITQELHQEVNA